MDTELIRTFLAVVRHRSFTAAAHELGYVQSTTTGHVHSLERHLGARLLDRLPTGAVPTDAGLRLLPHAERLLDVQDRLIADVATAPGRPSGQVRIMAPESLCAYRLPSFVTALRGEEPDVRIALGPGGTPDALEAIRRAAVDVAIVLEPALTVADVRLEPIGVEDLVLLDGPGPHARRTWAELAERDTLLLEEGCSYSDDVARQLLAAGQPVSRRTRFGSVEAIKQCAAAGLGWTVLPTVTAAPELRAGVLDVVPGPALPVHTVMLVTHPGRLHSAATDLVLSRLRALWAPPTTPHP